MPKASRNFIYGSNNNNAFINNITPFNTQEHNFNLVKNDITTALNDIILMNPDRASIFAALRHGRTVLSNIVNEINHVKIVTEDKVVIDSVDAQAQIEADAQAIADAQAQADAEAEAELDAAIMALFADDDEDSEEEDSEDEY